MSYGAINGVFEDDRIQVYPNRSISARDLRRVVAAFTVACALVALFSWLQGNIWAPLFALLNASAVGFGLVAAWRASEASDLIYCAGPQLSSGRTASQVVVERRRGAHAWRYEFDPFWAKLVETAEPGRLLLGSHGRSVEVGSFLNAEQRHALAVKINEFLRTARERAVT